VQPVATLRPGDRLAEFEVIRRLGDGGMGIVYLVRDVRLGRQVALKVIAPHLAPDPEFQERFAAEARSAAAIEHPNAVTIYSAGSADGHLFIAMRYIEGTDLRHSLAETGPLAPQAAARVVAEVAGALDAAHAAGFVHRDVKPANILLTGAPGSGTAYLTDFGLTRGLGSSQAQLTETGQWIGTLDYVAPEQVAGERIDARTDIYSLGTVLYEMLAGSVPFGGDQMQKLRRKTDDAPPPLPATASPRAFNPVLARAIARDPEHRFRSAGDLGRAASTAAGVEASAPTERSVATGAAAAGLREIDVRVRGSRPAPAQGTVRMPRVQRPAPAPRRPAPPPPAPAPPPRAQRRSSGRAVAIIAGALAVAAGLVAGALLLAGTKDPGTRTVITRRVPAPAQEKAAPVATSSAETASASAEETPAESTSTNAEADRPVSFEGSEYSATLPAGWIQGEHEKLASDGSYVENTWTSPSGDEELLIDMSPGEPADPAQSVAKIAGGIRESGQTVYSVANEVERGGLIGSEFSFHADSGLPERTDFFFNIGDAGFAVLSSGYDLSTAQARIGPLVSSLRMNYDY
jgi:serine/threonine-protein kinase